MNPQSDEESRLARNLRALRKRARLTQQQLADLAGLDRATISQIENGRESPRTSTVVGLAQVLGVRPVDLWRETIPAPSVPPAGQVREPEALTYEPLNQGELHAGLQELLEDQVTWELMNISEEEETMLRSIRTRSEATLGKQFFIDVLFAYRRSKP